MIPRKKLLLDFISILSIVNIFFIPEWANLIGEPVKDILGTPTPFRGAYYAIFFITLGMGLLLFGIVWIFEKYKFRKPLVLVHFLLLASFISALNFFREVSGFNQRFPFFSTVANSLVADKLVPLKLLVVSFVFLMVSIFALKLQNGIARALRIIGLICSPVILVFYGNLVVGFSKSIQHDLQPTNFPIAEKTRFGNRLVWIIFDEMDFRLVFDNRPKGIKFAHLDRLMKESLFFTQAFPPADQTIHSIPSLISGKKSHTIEYTQWDLKTNESAKHDSIINLSSTPNVFRVAKDLGYRTGIVGWYHNYCRVFRNELDYCRRFPAGRFGYSESFWGSIKVIFSRSLNFQKRYERTFVFNLEEMIAASSIKLASIDHNFLFIHLSIPHAPWIYDSEKKRISSDVSREPNQYFSNLELVDKTVGQFRKILEDAGFWNQTTVIISSDHSWRESHRYDGKRDYRVPFYIKMPDSKGIVVNQPTATILTKNFITSVLDKSVKTTEQARQWFEKANDNFPVGSVLIPFEEEVKYYEKLRAKSNFTPFQSKLLPPKEKLSTN